MESDKLAPKVLVCVTVDWEGQDLLSLRDLEQVRERLGPEVPLTHFVCPNYFHMGLPGAAEQVARQIRGGDELALHLHCLRPLVEAAGLPFRDRPDFHDRPGFLLGEGWARRFPLLARWQSAKVSGRGVPLSAYAADEQLRLLEFGRASLRQHLGRTAEGFRAGGWMASDQTLACLAELGFRYDSSAVPPAVFSRGFESLERPGSLVDDHGDSNGLFTDYMLRLWGDAEQAEDFLANGWRLAASPGPIAPDAQPFRWSGVLEIPNNGAMSDFASVSGSLRPLFDKAQRFVAEQGRDFVVVLGMHQEGQVEMKLPLVHFFKTLDDADRGQVEFLTLAEVARRWGEKW